MKAATIGTAARIAAAGNAVTIKRPVNYTILSEQILTTASQGTLSSGSATFTTGTNNPPGGQLSYLNSTNYGYSTPSRIGLAFNGPWDFTGTIFRFQVRCQHYAYSRYYNVRFATSKATHDAGNYFEIGVAPGNAPPNWLVPATWVWDSFDPLLMTAVGSGTSLTSIGYIAFGSADASSSQTCDWDFARIQRVQKIGTKAKCVIWHDDSVASGYAPIKAKLDAYGWAGSEANEWLAMDTGGTFIGAADLVQAKLSTWSIGTHAITSAEHISVNGPQFVNQALRSKTFAAKYGLSPDAVDFAYWGGLDTPTAYPQVQRLFRTGRWFTSKLQQPETLPPGDASMMKSLGADAGQTFANDWKPILQNAITTGGLAQIVFHQQIGSDSSQAAEFDAMLTWLDQNRANIDVVSFAAAIAPTLTGYVASTAPPTNPLTLTATPGNAQIVVSRTGGFGDGVALKLYRGSSATGTPIATALPFTDTGLTNGTAVSYIATAVNSAGTVTSNVVTATPAVPTPPAGTAVDNFNRADNATTLGTASDGGTWTVQTGTWGISSNRAYNAGGGSGAQVVRDLGSANHFVEANITYATSNVLIARCTDKNNWYGVALNSGKTDVYKFVSGSATLLTSVAVTATAGDLIRFTVNGSTLTVTQNGNVIKILTDTAITTGSKVGMRADNGTGWFDNFNSATV